MKSTGIVRRIDDLGRVVIPREIRKNMHIKEGDPLELYVSGKGEVIFKKYSPNNTDEVVDYLVKSARVLGFDIGVYDDTGMYRGGSRKDLIENYSDLETQKENLIIVADEAIYDRAYLYIKITRDSETATIESIKALAQMATIMLNEG